MRTAFSYSGERTKLVKRTWMSQMRRGMVDFCILAALQHGEDYGYGLLQRLESTGVFALTESTVYPALARLAREGFIGTRRIKSPQGPPRKYYRLTPEGKAHLQEMRIFWKALDAGIEQLFEKPKR